MPQVHHFQDFEFQCYENCIKPLEETLNDHRERLKISDIKFDLASKSGAITLSDETSLTYEENHEELRLLMQERLPQVNPQKRKRIFAWQTFLGLGAGLGLMVPMMFGLMLPFWAHPLMFSLGTALTVFLGRKSYLNAYHSLKSKKMRFNMDSLFTVSSIAAIVSSALHLFFPFFPPLIDAALMILGFRQAGLWIDQSFREQKLKTKKYVDYGHESKFQISYRQDGEYEACTLKDVELDDLIKIPAGQTIPLDGILQSEHSLVSYSMNNGSEDPMEVSRGHKLLAGMVAEQELLMKVTALEAQSDLNRRDLELFKAQAEAPPIQNLTDKIMQWFVPAVLGTAVVVGAAAGYFLGLSMGLTAAFYWAVCACPCALGLITPLAMKLGLSKFEGTGLSFNKPKGLQAAATIDTVVFDLTGTLTQNKPQVIEEPTVSSDHFDIISAIQSRILKDEKLKRKHPIAQALVNKLGMHPSEFEFEEFITADNGILAKIQGNVYRIGNDTFIQPSLNEQPKDRSQAQKIIYFEKNGRVEGYFLLADPLRPGASSVLKTLLANKMECCILTGASDRDADQYAPLLGFDRDLFITNQTPDSKAQIILQLKEAGKQVAMVGDGENDTLALTHANLSVAIGSPGSPLISEQVADASLHSFSLQPLLQIFPAGQQVMRVIKQNLALSFTYNTLSLAYVCCCLTLMPSMLIPYAGAAVMVLLSASVMFNTYRVLRNTETLAQVAPPSPPSSPALTFQDITHSYEYKPLQSDMGLSPILKVKTGDTVKLGTI